MEALGTEYVEVTWHSGARPSHQEWQGKVYRWNRGTGKSAKYKALGYDTVQVSSYGMCSETCKPWQGRVYIDDTFSGWTGETETRAEGVLWGKSNYCGKWFPLLSSAIDKGLFHPNCWHSINLWRDGDPLPESIDNTDTERRYKLEQQQRALERAIRKAKRRVEGFTDPENIKKAQAELRQAQKALREFINKVNADEGVTVLKRDLGREQSSAAELTEAEKNDIIKYEENQKKLRAMIANGEISLELNPQIQNRHYKGTKEYNDFLSRGTEKSYFNVPMSELQSFVKENASKGELFFSSKGVVRERFFFKENAAYDTKLKKLTSYITVHYSKNRTHVSPYTPRIKER